MKLLKFIYILLLTQSFFYSYASKDCNSADQVDKDCTTWDGKPGICKTYRITNRFGNKVSTPGYECVAKEEILEK